MGTKPEGRAGVAYALLALTMVVSFGLMLASARSDSVTTDESTHLFAGYTYLTTGDFRLNPEHPPLLKELAALPLLLMRDVRVTLDARWDRAADFYFDAGAEAAMLGKDFLFSWGNDADALLIRGRIVAILLTELLGFCCFFWARAMYGPAAGVCAAALILFLPTTLAHGHLVTTDVAVSTFLLLSVMCFGRYLARPTGKALIATGLFTGLAFSSKFTGLSLVWIFAAIMVLNVRGIRGRAVRRARAAGIASVFVIAWLVVWSSYGWSLRPAPSTGGALSQRILMTAPGPIIAAADAGFSAFRHVLLPSGFFKGAVSMTRHALTGHPSFLLGMHSGKGWWYYFPVAILVKTPIPLLALFVLALATRRRTDLRHPDEYLLLVAPAVYLAIGMMSRADLGVRHMLPLFPFIAVFVSQMINRVDWDALRHFRHRPRAALPAVGFVALMVWYSGGTALAFPNYIAYFNEFAGGEENGRFILTDSNVDWGQDMRRIKAYLDRAGIDDAFIVYPWSGREALAYYGIAAAPLEPGEMVRGRVVASATYLESDGYSWLKHYPASPITPGVVLVDVR